MAPERESEPLPVPYFHVVFTVPGPIADIAYQNKAAIYDLLFKAAAEATLTNHSQNHNRPMEHTSIQQSRRLCITKWDASHQACPFTDHAAELTHYAGFR